MDDIRPLLDDDIDLILSRSAPITPLALAVRDDELQIAVAGARLEAARRHRHRRTPRVAAFTAVAVLMLGGAGSLWRPRTSLGPRGRRARISPWL